MELYFNLPEYFLKYMYVQTGRHQDQYVVLLYDGHASLVNPETTEWAKAHTIILFVLPPDTCHILQPLDFACLGPFK